MSQTVEVRFKGTRKAYFVWADERDPLRLGDAVIVEVERGRDLGRVTAVGDVAAKKCAGGCTGCAVGEAAPAEPAPPKPVLRRATPRGPAGARRDPPLGRGRRPPQGDRAGPGPRPGHEGERHRVAVGPEQAHDLLHRREAGRLPRAGARPRLALPHPHRAAADRRARRGRPALRRGTLRPGVLLLHLAHGALAGQPRPGQGPAPLAQSRARSPAAAAACSAASSTSTSSTSRPGKRFPKEGKTAHDRRAAPEKVIAVDIFRERVFLRSEEHGSRIIPLVQLREEVEPLGEVLLTAGRGPPRRDGESPAAAAADGLPAAWTGTARGQRADPRRPRRATPGAAQRRGAGVTGGGPRSAAGPGGGDGGPDDRAVQASARRAQRGQPAARPDGPRSPATLRSRRSAAEVLPHHRHRLLQRRPPPRPRAREGRRRLHRALPPAPRRRRPLPHGHGRAPPDGARRRPSRAGMSPQAWVDRMAERLRGVSGGGSSAATTTGSAPPSRGTTRTVHGAARADPAAATRTTSTSASTRASTASAARSSSSRRQIVDGHCIEHPTLELVPTKERNQFFRLSRYRDRLLDADPLGRVPGGARHPAERDRPPARGRARRTSPSSRNRSVVGHPVPRRSREQTVYVWFDALINYLSATGFPDAGYERLWPADLHVVGKGITRFHCVIWPAMLLSAGRARCPARSGPTATCSGKAPRCRSPPARR